MPDREGRRNAEENMAMERWRPFGGMVEHRDPFRMSDIQGEVNRLFDSFLGRPTTTMAPSGERMWAPAVDIWEDKDNLVLMFEIPGIRDKDVHVSITEDRLTVRGERRFDRDVKNESYHRLERVYGKFERNVQLPMPVQSDKVKAVYRDGVLEISLPKAEEVKPKEIKIDMF
jgi:HSP20 family protein